jgi:predicted ABC-class ATPase
MGIAQGVTLIVGGGYHGKSTLLRAIERGYLDHIPGDGRERVVATEDAVKIRAEDGRSVVHTDISAFITNLPSGDDTTCFSTTNASGSTSQAAAISEALEMGASTLLLDEDTCATNFMIRDLRMQKLVAKDDEPITPFLDRVRGLYENGGVSSLLVMGGAGDYFDVADTVIMMKQYRPLDVTQQARSIASEFVSAREPCHLGHSTPKKRRANFRSLGVSAGPKGIKVRVRDIDLMSFGREDVRIACVEQLVEKAQVRAIGQALLGLSEGALTKQQTLREALDDIESMVHTEGLESITRRVSGDLAWFRKYELAAVLTRLRTLEMNKPT